MGDRFWKGVAALGGAAALFYAVGFTVVQSYVYKNGFQGIFWLTREFYRDAGAAFILDLIRVPMLAPYIFFPYLGLLLLLIPTDRNLLLFCTGEGTLSNQQWVKILALLGIMVLTGIFALYYGAISNKELFTEFIDLLRRSEESTLIEPERSLAFFSLVTPVIAIMAIFVYRSWKCLSPTSKRREILGFIFLFYLLFLSIIPITYGFYLYDLKIVPIKDPHLVRTLSGKKANSVGKDEIWLLGEFGNKYVFFRKVKNPIETQGIIETYDVSEIKHLNFNMRQASTLKMHMTYDVPDPVKQSQKENTMKWIMQDLGKPEVKK